MAQERGDKYTPSTNAPSSLECHLFVRVTIKLISYYIDNFGETFIILF